jgi:hypothetical protein
VLVLWEQVLLRLAVQTGRTVIAALLVMSCSAGDIATTAQPISGGIDDDGDPAVVALLSRGRAVCTGTIVAPHVVLTAAHCAALPIDRVFVGADPRAPGVLREIVATRTHPEFNAVNRAHDLALLVVDPALPGAPIPMRARDDLVVGQEVRVVGFGLTEKLDTAPLRKREGIAAIAAVAEQDFSLRPAPAQPCRGDSGGPVLAQIDGAEHLIGVVSDGDIECTARSRAMRVDRELGSFIAPFLAEVAERSRALGERCRYPLNCASGLCVAPDDAPAIGYCSRVCTSNADCPSTMACGAQPDGVMLCRRPLPSPGALGTQCADSSDCGDARCARSDASSPLTCTKSCMPQYGSACPTGYSCRSEANRPDSYGCFPEQTAAADASCALSGTRRASFGLLFCCAALGLVLRRRR